jgi:hypothetical protein
MKLQTLINERRGGFYLSLVSAILAATFFILAIACLVVGFSTKHYRLCYIGVGMLYGMWFSLLTLAVSAVFGRILPVPKNKSPISVLATYMSVTALLFFAFTICNGVFGPMIDATQLFAQLAIVMLSLALLLSVTSWLWDHLSHLETMLRTTTDTPESDASMPSYTEKVEMV